MHKTLKSVLAALCQGHPLRWPKLLQPCQVIMNQAVHTSTGQQLYFSFFSRYPPLLVSASLPSVDGAADELAEAHALVRETHQKMSRRYRDVANRARKTQRVEVGSLVWVRNEVPVPGTCKKLNPKWGVPSGGSGARWQCLSCAEHIHGTSAAASRSPSEAVLRQRGVAGGTS